MGNETPVDWEKGNEFLLTCGSVHEPYRFCTTVLDKISEFVSYDQALFLMLDGNRKITRSHFVGLSDRWVSMYLNYYSKSSLGDFALSREVIEIDSGGLVILIDWHDLDSAHDDFITNYIRPRRLSQSLTFTLFDLKGAPATSFSLDRLVDKTFTYKEIEFVTLATAHLGNLYKNMFVRPQGQVYIWDRKTGAEELTGREKEILDLLCQGVKPAYISRELHISLGTTNKHIAHIYKKLGVDSRQELLVKILGK